MASITNSYGADSYPSAFQWIEKLLYYLNEQINKTELKGTLGLSKWLAIQYLSWPIIMVATPLTASIDIGMGIYEAFYAKYKGAISHQITLIIQKKMIASPIQHLAFFITNLVFPSLMGIKFFLLVGIKIHPRVSFNLSYIPYAIAYAVVVAPMFASLNYFMAQCIVGQKLPA